MLSPDDVHNADFARSWRRNRSYDEDEVDEFLDRVDATLSGHDAVTAHEVLGVRFSPRKRGKRAYRKSQVDAFLDKVALTLLKREVRQAEKQPGRAAASDGDEHRSRETASAPVEESAAAPDESVRHRQVPPGRTVRGERPPAPRDRPSREGEGSAARSATPSGVAGPRPTVPPRAGSSPAGPDPAGPASAGPSPAGRGPAALDVRAARRPMVAHQSGEQAQSVLDKSEVDAFVDRVEATLRGADSLTAEEVLNASFNPPLPGRPGYPEAGVVAFLVTFSTSIGQLSTSERTVPPQRMGIARAFRREQEEQAPKLTPELINNVALHAPAAGQPGYDVVQVDAFLDRVEATLRGADALTAQDVHEVRFHEYPPGRGGYDQDEVESLMDLVAECLAPVPRTDRQPATQRFG
ncbi:DivIVA domain-containing protein [Parasphingorhabdus pacifica]